MYVCMTVCIVHVHPLYCCAPVFQSFTKTIKIHKKILAIRVLQCRERS